MDPSASIGDARNEKNLHLQLLNPIKKIEIIR